MSVSRLVPLALSVPIKRPASPHSPQTASDLRLPAGFIPKACPAVSALPLIPYCVMSPFPGGSWPWVSGGQAWAHTPAMSCGTICPRVLSCAPATPMSGFLCNYQASCPWRFPYGSTMPSIKPGSVYLPSRIAPLCHHRITPLSKNQRPPLCCPQPSDSQHFLSPHSSQVCMGANAFIPRWPSPPSPSTTVLPEPRTLPPGNPVPSHCSTGPGPRSLPTHSFFGSTAGSPEVRRAETWSKSPVTFPAGAWGPEGSRRPQPLPPATPPQRQETSPAQAETLQATHPPSGQSPWLLLPADSR